jgi:hypothetical protein
MQILYLAKSGNLLVQPSLLNLCSNLTQEPWYRLSFSNYRKEIGVVGPTRNNVLVKVLSDSRSSKLTLIHSQIETLSPRYFPKYLHSAFAKSRHFGSFFGCGVFVASNMTVGANKQVARVVGKKI